MPLALTFTAPRRDSPPKLLVLLLAAGGTGAAASCASAASGSEEKASMARAKGFLRKRCLPLRRRGDPLMLMFSLWCVKVPACGDETPASWPWQRVAWLGHSGVGTETK